MSKIKTALVGFGYAGRVIHAPLIKACPQMELKIFVSSEPQKVHTQYPDALVEPDLASALQKHNLDLVVIATPNKTHYRLGEEALKAGCHVVIDKPLTVTSQEAIALGQLAKTQKRQLSVFQNRRFDADFLALQEVLASGILGKLSHFESHFDRFRPKPQNRWRDEDPQGGGLWYDLGPHLLDQALILFGWPEKIFCDLTNQREGALTTDYFQCRLAYGNMRVILSASTLVSTANARFIVHGDKGSFIKFGLDSQEKTLKLDCPASTQTILASNFGLDTNPAEIFHYNATNDDYESQTLEPNCGQYKLYYEEVAAAILQKESAVTEARLPVTAEEGIRVIRLIETGLDSNKEGRWLTL
jgi:predicted dehydrogenase